ncbi:hypothetical protein JCM10207_006843 [Rhodosporidiobolus poonsookiae]
MPHEMYRSPPPPPSGARPFPTPFDQVQTYLRGQGDYRWNEIPDYFDPPCTAHEIAMLALSYEIRSKPDWHLKYRDPDIRAKWRKEALEAAPAVRTVLEDPPARHRVEASPPAHLQAKDAEEDSEDEDDYRGVDSDENWEYEHPGPRDEQELTRLSEKMVDYVLDELAWHEEQLKDESGIRLSCFHKVYESDTLIPSSLRAELLTHVAALESSPPHGTADWHPGSNQQVLDLVHPSLYPLRYGITPVRALDDEGKVTDRVEAPEPRNAIHSASKKYQWLPSDFDVDVEGKVSISSYINNLHPVDHACFYPVLASLFERFLPMFERVLSDLQVPIAHHVPVTRDMAHEWYPDMPAGLTQDEEEDWYEVRLPSIPQPGEFRMPSNEELAKKAEEGPAFPLKGRKLQVIVKLASIHLTPEQPTYEGGVWHVEGMQNEEIVASGIYYFDQENITDSQLAFRGTFDDQFMHHMQWDNRGVRTIWGVDDGSALLQYYNALDTKAGRAICFPNIYQHKVSSFSLEEKSKPGYRKILVFFLVDPLKSAAGEVISTARVAPQQSEWIWRAIPEHFQSKLPVETWHKILNHLDGLLDFDEAKREREELMHERKYLVQENDLRVFKRLFSLCEH